MRLRRNTILNALPVLAPPTNVTAEVSGSDIIISWTAASSVDGYYIYQQIDDGAWTKLNATATTDLTYTLTPTEPGEYNFRVTSVRGTKESAPSAETLLDDVFYFAVNSTQTIGGLFSTTGEITVHWGDGTSNTYNGTNKAWSKDYGSAVDELVVIEGSDSLDKFTMEESGADISFDLKDLPTNLTSFQCDGLNTISGSLADLPSGLTYFNCQGANTVDTYTTRIWTTKPTTFLLVPVSPGGLSETEINQLLIDLDDTFDWSTGTITLTGTNEAPTGAGLAAVNNMRSEGATVTVNS